MKCKLFDKKSLKKKKPHHIHYQQQQQHQPNTYTSTICAIIFIQVCTFFYATFNQLHSELVDAHSALYYCCCWFGGRFSVGLNTRKSTVKPIPINLILLFLTSLLDFSYELHCVCVWDFILVPLHLHRYWRISVWMDHIFFLLLSYFFL